MIFPPPRWNDDTNKKIATLQGKEARKFVDCSTGVSEQMKIYNDLMKRLAEK